MNNLSIIKLCGWKYMWKGLITMSIILLLSSADLICQVHPNVLLIISDDLGVDVTNGYQNNALMPATPTLDSLRDAGVTFDNLWATPKCTPTRGAIMSGKFGVKTGVLGTPGNLDTTNVSLFRELSNQTNNAYADALIGKWHLSQGGGFDMPEQHGADYFMGSYGAAVNAYDNWTKTESGSNTIETNYATTEFTDASIEWIDDQTKPWFLWLAHVAPHGPVHTPPSDLYTIGTTETNFRKYIAMIEAMDHEIGRLLGSLSAVERENTIVIYLGDNGTPGNFLQNYPSGHGKSTLYQGGIHVPMFVSGRGINRVGEREDALIHVSDIYATILELTGAALPGGLYNSLSFAHLLTGGGGAERDYNYSELQDNTTGGWTIRDRQYKLIEFTSGDREMYDLISDPLETNNLLLRTLITAEQEVMDDLVVEATVIRTGWSCRDFIQNGDEEDIDCDGSLCDLCDPVTTATDIQLESDALVFYPNPTDSIFEIRGILDDYTIHVLDASGNIYQTLNSTTSTIEVDLTTLPEGLYFVSVLNQSNTLIHVETIIKAN